MARWPWTFAMAGRRTLTINVVLASNFDYEAYPVNDTGIVVYDGRIYLQEDQSRIIRYRIRNEGHWYQLDYNVDTNGIVTSVDWRYIP